MDPLAGPQVSGLRLSIGHFRLVCLLDQLMLVFNVRQDTVPDGPEAGDLNDSASPMYIYLSMPFQKCPRAEFLFPRFACQDYEPGPARNPWSKSLKRRKSRARSIVDSD